MTCPRILVINPNSNEAVTRSIDEALEPLRRGGVLEIDCRTLEEGPFGIESQADVDSVAPLLARLVSAMEADAAVIACYSDPGLQACREATAEPVLGIAECGVLTALARGDRFGVIAILERSIPRHLRYMRQLGLTDRLVGERALGLRVHELAHEELTWRRMVEAGTTLRDMGADVLVLGCAGMTRYRGRLETELGLPVIDPTLAAVAMAAGILLSEKR